MPFLPGLSNMTLLEETDMGEGGIALIRTNRESTNEAENVLHQRFQVK